MAYGTNTGLTDYAAATGRAFTGDANVARNIASVYIDGLYWDRFKGSPADPYGPAWPRNIYPGIPVAVENATYEAALLWSVDNGALTGGGVTNSGSGGIAREKVDVIEVAYHAASGSLTGVAVLDGIPRYDVIDALLRPFLKSGRGGVAAFVV